MLVLSESSSAVLVTISMQQICVDLQPFPHAKSVDSRRDRSFYRGTKIWHSYTEDSVESTFIAESFFCVLS